jgi:CHAD domain-containing protein
VRNAPHQYSPFRTRLDAFAGELTGLEEGEVEALHRTRVASRRLRELLPLLRLDRDATRTLNRRLRKVTKQLGTVRELDVLTLLIEELQGSRRYSPGAWKRISAAVAHAHMVAREQLAAELPIRKLRRLARRLERTAAHVKADADTRRSGASGPTRAWLWALEARLARRAALVRSAIEVAGALYMPERLHDVRIALKKLRYVAELSSETGRLRITADLAALKAAQDVLGRLHDLEVLRGWGREVQASLSPPDLTAWRELGLVVRALEDNCRQLHARYMHDRARLIAIADRMRVSRTQAMPAGHRAAS